MEIRRCIYQFRIAVVVWTSDVTIRDAWLMITVHTTNVLDLNPYNTFDFSDSRAFMVTSFNAERPKFGTVTHMGSGVFLGGRPHHCCVRTKNMRPAVCQR